MKKSETSRLPLLRVPQKHQAYSHNVFDLELSHAGSMFAASVSVSTHETWLVDSSPGVLNSSGSYSPSSLFSEQFPQVVEEGPSGDLPPVLSLHLMFLQGSVLLFFSKQTSGSTTVSGNTAHSIHGCVHV